MKKLLWMIFLFGVYIWIMTSGHDRLVFETSKMVYQSLVSWFEDAEIDFQITKEKSPRQKKTRRWD